MEMLLIVFLFSASPLTVSVMALLSGGSVVGALAATSVWGFCSHYAILGQLQWHLSSLLVLLTLVILTWSLPADPCSALGKNYRSILASMVLVLWLVFRASSYLAFYVFFEFSLVPIFLLVLGWGYQPERLPAAMSLVMYTVCASLPLFLIVVCLLHSPAGSSAPVEGKGLMQALTWLSVAGFLVKFPVYGAHLWLPKAHVEAPVVGSMFLAAILLKLGGYGMILLAPFAVASAIKGVLVPLALVGGALAAVITILQVDSKTLIAYSSVAHMALVIAALSSESPLGFGGGVALMVAHALASSGLFYSSFVLYSRSSTRSLLLARSNLSVLPVLSLWVFILVMANMGAPPTVNLLSEVLTVSSILGQSLASFLPLGVVLMAAVAFSLVYYNSTQHGQEPSLSSSLAPLHSLESAVLSVHGGSTIAAFFVVNLFL